jgi:peptide/nickel transport system substrate-binding protein
LKRRIGMRRYFIVATLVLAALAPLAAQVKQGPIVDKVIFDVRMDQTIGVKDTAEGKTDVFIQGLDGRTFQAISEADRAKLDTYTVPSTWWSFQFNPVPNAAPYTHTMKDGKTVFNPFAIREVRFAMNWLIDRTKIVEEILLGSGLPMYTPMTTGQPGTYKYNLIAAKLGITPRGNEKKALADIEAAMQAASKLPENVGKLAKTGQWWTWEGEPVVVKFLIRVDEPTGRLLLGRHVATLIEKAGIKVEKLELDRAKCLNTLQKFDPADFGWHIYTEGWTAGATRAWWDVSVAQMYSPWYANMPGGQIKGFWQYENKEIDELSQKNFNGWFLDADEYWGGNMKAVEMGLKEAIRVCVATQISYYVVNKERMKSRMAYGLAEGPSNYWSIRTADVPPNANGEKVLRVTQFSARGSLFMNAWDPVGSQGFSDTYANNIARMVVDMATYESPSAAKASPWRAVWNPSKSETKIAPNPKGGAPIGLIPVDKKAIIYNSKTKRWESGVEYKDVGDGVYDYVKSDDIKSYSKNVVTYIYGKWHSGQSVTLADLMYATAFQAEWANKDSDGDKMYDAAFSSRLQPTLSTQKGQVINADGTFTGYYDYNWPMDKDRLSAAYLPSPQAGVGGRPTTVSWEIYEALAKMVLEGSASKTVYTFSNDASLTEVDVIQPKCVADIKAKLQEMLAAKYVPSTITTWCSPDQATVRYKAAIAFIDKYGHALIGNGPFFISKVDTTANYIELTAFRDYPWKSDYYTKLFKTDLTRIDDVKAPATAQKTKDIPLDITVSQVTYPNDTAKAADAKAKVTVTLISPDNSEKVYDATFVKTGSFQALIPAKDLAAMKSGSYTIVVQSSLASESPSIKTETMILF